MPKIERNNRTGSLKLGVIYVRYSSNNQREESAEAQERACRAYSNQNNIAVIRVYKDCAKTGRNTTGRDAFNEMMEAAKNNEFDCIIVHKSDRLSRNRYDAITCKHKLKQYGVELVSVLENFGNNPESILLESLMDGLNEYYSQNLSREVKKGMLENAYKCKSLGGTPPLGYDIDPETKRYVINQSEAYVVSRIFDMYGEGVGYRRILRYLNNEMGFTTKTGKAFSSSSLNCILKNEKYIGTYIFNQKHEKDCFGNRKPQKNDESEIIRIPGGMPQIVTKELFDLVQERLKSNNAEKVKANSKNEPFLLTGKIRCGICGAPMTGNTKWCNDGKKRYSTYRCTNRVQHKAQCHNKELRKDYIENFVFRKTINSLLDETQITKIYYMLETEINREKVKIREDLDNVYARKRKIQEEINTLRKNENEQKMEELNEKLNKLQKQGERLFDILNMKNINLELVKEKLKEMQEFVTSSDDEKCWTVIQKYVEYIEVFEDEVHIKFYEMLEESDHTLKVSI